MEREKQRFPKFKYPKNYMQRDNNETRGIE